MEKLKSFDIFEDRILSLLERWKTFRNKDSFSNNTDSVCIKGFMNEINDGFSDILIERETEKTKYTAICGCGYKTKSYMLKELLSNLTDEGGYISEDTNGVCHTRCPICKEDRLILS